MSDQIGESGGKKKAPTWIWLAVGGGALLLVMLKGGGTKSSSTTETDNLLAAEIDATLKSMKAAQEDELKQYKEDEQQAWEDFRQSMEDLIRERQGADNPGVPITPPAWWTNPPPWWNNHQNPTPPGDENPSPTLPPPSTEPGGAGKPGNIPGSIEGAMLDNYVQGFDYSKTKVK